MNSTKNNRKKLEAIAQKIANCVTRLSQIDSTLDLNLTIIAKKCCPFYVEEDILTLIAGDTSPVKSILFSKSAKNYLIGLRLAGTNIPKKSELGDYKMYITLQESGCFITETLLKYNERDAGIADTPTLEDFVMKKGNVAPSLLSLFEACVGLGKEFKDRYLELKKLSDELALATCPFSVGEVVRLKSPAKPEPVELVLDAIGGSIFESYYYNQDMGGKGMNLDCKAYFLVFGKSKYAKRTTRYSNHNMTSVEELNGKSVTPCLADLF